MAKGTAIAYLGVGGLLLYSGVRGASIADTVTAALKGNLGGLQDTESVDFAATDASSPATSGSGSVASGSASAAQAYAKSQMSKYGWTDAADWTDLVQLWTRESGWNNKAKNPSSGAYGIPQALPATKMPTEAQAAPVGTSDAESQIDWGLQYIESTYGSPAMAWAHEQANDWY